MAKNLKPYVVPLDADLAAEILNIPLPYNPAEEPLVAGLTVGDRVRFAVAAVEAANKYLAESKMASIVADTVMRKLKKRGVPSLRVQPDGTVVLHVSYEETAKEKVKPLPVQQSTRKSDLPKLDDLRKQAKEIGVDISALGRARRAIYERIQVARTSLEGPTEPPAKVIRRRAGEPDKVVRDDEEPLPPEAGEGVDVDAFLEGMM